MSSLSLRDPWAYRDDAGVPVASRRYRQGTVEMTVALPGSPDSLEDLEAGITSQRFDRWVAGS
jgi:hypothetical protein